MVNILFPRASQLLSVNSFSLHYFSFLQEKKKFPDFCQHLSQHVQCMSSLSCCSTQREAVLKATAGCTWCSCFSSPPANKTEKTAMDSCSLCEARSSLKCQTVPEEKLEMSWDDSISGNSLHWIMYMNPQIGVCKSGNTSCLRLCPVQ